MSRLVIRNAHLWSPEPGGIRRHGDLLIVGTQIAALGTIQPCDAPAEVIDAAGMIALPGFVDTHRHTWQSALRHMAVGWDLFTYIENLQMVIAGRMTPEDVYIGTLLGALSCLDAGITTLCDEAHVMNTPEHADAAIQGLRDAGIRARFNYGWPCDDAMRWMFNSSERHPDDVRRVREHVLDDDDALVTLGAHLRGPEMVGIDLTMRDLELTRELGLRSSMHVGNGDVGRRLHGIDALERAGAIGPDLTFVHCCTSTDDELRMIAASGAHASACAFVETAMPGLGDPATARLLYCGTRPSFGVDVEVAAAGDMFTVMRAALASHRLLEARDPEYASRTLPLTPTDLLAFATIDGARAAGLGNRTGSLAAGQEADVLLIDIAAPNLAPVGDVPGAIVAAANPSNVDTVIVAGRIVKRHGQLLAPEFSTIVERAAHSRTRLMASAARDGSAARDAVGEMPEPRSL